jgi:hypothetical protein
MPNFTAKEWELLSFFEVEPELQDDAPWDYNNALYTVRRGNQKLTFTISTLYSDVHIILFNNENRVYGFSAKGIHDVRYIAKPGIETLHIHIDNTESVAMTIRLKPNIVIEQNISRYRASSHGGDRDPAN